LFQKVPHEMFKHYAFWLPGELSLDAAGSVRKLNPKQQSKPKKGWALSFAGPLDTLNSSCLVLGQVAPEWGKEINAKVLFSGLFSLW